MTQGEADTPRSDTASTPRTTGTQASDGGARPKTLPSRSSSFSRSGSFSDKGYTPLAVLPSASVEAKPITRRRARSIETVSLLPTHEEEDPTPDEGPTEEAVCRILTYNVKGKRPTEFNLRGLLMEDLSPAHAVGRDREAYQAALRRGPEFLCVGLQEIVPLKVSTVVNAADESQQGKLWQYSLDLAVSDLTAGGERYCKIGDRQMVGLLMALYVKESVAPQLSRVQTGAVPTGFGGKMKNKGAVAVRFNYHDVSFVFLCAHLAPHVQNNAIRNREYLEVTTRMQFPDAPGVLSHEAAVFFGDLNYRVVGEPGPVALQARAGDLGPLLEADQLAQSRAAGLAFQGFREAPINFGPTFKFDCGSDDFCPEYKKRTPSWTDRVLFTGRRAEAIWYGSMPQFRTSDHKPVVALVRFRVPVVRTPGVPPPRRPPVPRSATQPNMGAPTQSSRRGSGGGSAPVSPFVAPLSSGSFGAYSSSSSQPSTSHPLPLNAVPPPAAPRSRGTPPAPPLRSGGTPPQQHPPPVDAGPLPPPPPHHPLRAHELEGEAAGEPWWASFVPCCLRLDDGPPPRHPHAVMQQPARARVAQRFAEQEEDREPRSFAALNRNRLDRYLNQYVEQPQPPAAAPLPPRPQPSGSPSRLSGIPYREL